MLVYQRVGGVFIINNEKDYNHKSLDDPFLRRSPEGLNSREMVALQFRGTFVAGKKWKTENQSL